MNIQKPYKNQAPCPTKEETSNGADTAAVMMLFL